MKTFLAGLRRAMRLIGAPARALPDDPTVSALVELLRQHGMQLAVVSEDRPALQVSSRRLLEAAIARALAAGEPEAGLRSRLARLLGRDKARVVRALAGAELDDEARAALEAHLLEPRKHPLPPAERVGRPPGRRAGEEGDQESVDVLRGKRDMNNTGGF